MNRTDKKYVSEKQGDNLTELCMIVPSRTETWGSICSLILFSLFIKERANGIIQKAKHGVNPLEYHVISGVMKRVLTHTSCTGIAPTLH